MPAVHCYLGQAHLASWDIPAHSHSIAYFCQSCGEVWARLIAEPLFDVEVICCPGHTPQAVRSWSRVPGALTLGDTDHLSTMSWAAAYDLFPEPVLLREFSILYEHALKESP